MMFAVASEITVVQTPSVQIIGLVAGLGLALIGYLNLRKTSDTNIRLAELQVQQIRAQRDNRRDRAAVRKTLIRTNKITTERLDRKEAADKLVAEEHAKLIRLAISTIDGPLRSEMQKVAELLRGIAEESLKPHDIAAADLQDEKLARHDEQIGQIVGMSSDSLKTVIAQGNAPADVSPSAQKVADLSVAHEEAVKEYAEERKPRDDGPGGGGPGAGTIWTMPGD